MALQILFLVLQFFLVVFYLSVVLATIIGIEMPLSYSSFIILTLAHIACLAVATGLRNLVWTSLLGFSPEHHVEPGWWTLFALVLPVFISSTLEGKKIVSDHPNWWGLLGICVLCDPIFIELVFVDFFRNQWSAWIMSMRSEPPPAFGARDQMTLTTTPLGGAIPTDTISWVSTQLMGTSDTAVSPTLPKQDLVAMGPAGAENRIVLKSSMVGSFDRLLLWFTILCVFAAAFVTTGLCFPRRRPTHGRGYKYERLDVGSKEIRLLRILPSFNADDMVRCRIRNVSLSENPVYAALSYCWGGHSQKRGIELNGSTVHVTANLEEALRQMRRWWTSIDIWIDALCIDQTSKSERAAQVLRMFAIYQEARVVAIWLGPEAHGSDKVMMKLSQNQGTNQPYDYGERFSRPVFEDNEPPTSEEVRAFLLRPYWYRIWIIQEIAAAREMCVLCGDWTIELKDIARFLCELVAQDMSSAAQPSPIKQLFDIRNARRDQKPIALLDALHRTSHSSSLEMLDKVYGLLGVVRDRTTFVTEPNYSLSHRQLCLTMTKNAIIETGFLDILFLSGLHAKSTNLPSWCPDYISAADWDPAMIKYLSGEDFRKRSGKIINRWNTTGDTRVSSTTVWFDQVNGILRAKGLILETIESIDDVIQDEQWTGLRKGFVEEEFRGWAHSDTKPGDHVYLLHGCSIPVILRPVTGHEKRFNFVGRIYVPNALNNENAEALANDARWIELC